MMKRAVSAQERMYRAQMSFRNEIEQKQERGEIARVEEYQLKALSKLSLEDQKLVFAANGNGAQMGMSEGQGCRSINMDFGSLDEFKTFLKIRADAFARDQANRPPSMAPAASAFASTAQQTPKATNTADKDSHGTAALSTKFALPSTPPTARMVNAAVALQVLQSASKANSTS